MKTWLMKMNNFLNLSIKDTLYTIAILCLSTLLCFLIRSIDDGIIVIAMVYLLAVVSISRLTHGFFYGAISCGVAVICDNYIFTYPYFKLNFSIPTYPISFLSMFVVSFIISAMTSQLKEKESFIVAARTEKMRSNLLLAVSHDLRTPLTSIIGSSSVLLENYDMISDDRKKQLLQEVNDEAQWLIHMVENLLFITRIQDKAAKLTKRPEIADEIIAEAVTKTKKRYPDAPIQVELPNEIILVPMDAMLVEQVILNLFENAIRHSETATEISLVLTSDQDDAIFEVRDNGVGIAEKVLPHLFDGLARTSKDDRIDTTKDMGIGLTVCHSIILAHNGSLEGHNNTAGGASFIFRLPLKEDTYE